MPTKKQIQEAKTIRVFADVAYLYPTADKLPAKYSKIVLLFTKRNFVEGKRWVLESIRIYLYDENEKLLKTITKTDYAGIKELNFYRLMPQKVIRDMVMSYNGHFGKDDNLWNDLKEIDDVRKTRDIWHEKWDYEEDWKEPTPISVNPSIRANFRYKIDDFSFEDMEGKSDAEKIEKLLGHKTSTPKRKPQNKFPQLNVRNMF